MYASNARRGILVSLPVPIEQVIRNRFFSQELQIYLLCGRRSGLMGSNWRVGIRTKWVAVFWREVLSVILITFEEYFFLPFTNDVDSAVVRCYSWILMREIPVTVAKIV